MSKGTLPQSAERLDMEVSLGIAVQQPLSIRAFTRNFPKVAELLHHGLRRTYKARDLKVLVNQRFQKVVLELT